ncbi:MAG: glycogen synthase [Kineosporiaceae bacterium]
MRVDLLTREWPPHVYGGGGVHVTELAAALVRAGVGVSVRAFGADVERVAGPAVHGYPDLEPLAGANAAVRTLGVDLTMAADVAVGAPDVVHSHTWYANLAGHLGGLLSGAPHVLTAHSLEPLRPWKAEQLGGGYRVSSWAESAAYRGASAVIAVSAAMRRDILRSYPFVDPDRVHVVHNGVDTTAWRPSEDVSALGAAGVDPAAPSVVFVGRITRQKGLPYLLRAAAELPAEVQLVLLAGAADTPEIRAEVVGLVDGLRRSRSAPVVWIDRMLPREEVRQFLTRATVFVCPSVYEPLGIVNLEAMACGAAVVGTATGGIPEVVAPGRTGWLVPIDQVDDGSGTPVDPDRFVADLAATLVEAVSDPGRAAALGRAGRARAQAEFSWDAVAARTVEVYDTVPS